MTLGNLLSDLYRRLNYATTPDSTVTTRLTAFLNTVHRQILTKPGLGSLRDDTVTFASVAAQARYGLPPAVGAIQTVTDRTNNVRLTRRSRDWLRSIDPGLTASGVSTDYIPLGLQQVARQPSDASSLFIDSTSPSDTGTCYIEGIRTGGYYYSASVVMTGTTGVNVASSITDWIEVTKCYLSTAAIGTVTLTEDAEGGTVLATIPRGQTYSRQQSVQLWPTPASVITYYVDYVRPIADMSIGTDEPLLPEEYHWLLEVGARMKEYEKQDDPARYLAARREYEDGLRGLVFWVAQQVTGRQNLRGQTLGGSMRWPSQLGGNYPAGS